MSRYLYGVPVMTLSDIVTELNIEQGNLGQNHFVSTMVSAKWAWKDILWNVAWSVAEKQITVVDNKITLPSDMVRLVNISVMDKCGKLQPLGHNPNINTLELVCAKTSCSCSSCDGKGTLCGAIDNITVTEEDVVIDGSTYTKTTTTRSDQGGIYRIISMPALNDADPPSVEYVEVREFVCALETDSNGCIKYTEPNRRSLMEHCGCWLPLTGSYVYPNLGEPCAGPYPYSDRGDSNKRDCQRTVPETRNEYGYYNWDAVAGDVIHLKSVTASSVIVAYQTSGESINSEMLVPETAVDAVKFGIIYRQRAFAPANVVGRAEKYGARVDYERAKDELWKFRNPIRMDEFIKTQTTMPKW